MLGKKYAFHTIRIIGVFENTAVLANLSIFMWVMFGIMET